VSGPDTLYNREEFSANNNNTTTRTQRLPEVYEHKGSKHEGLGQVVIEPRRRRRRARYARSSDVGGRPCSTNARNTDKRRRNQRRHALEAHTGSSESGPCLSEGQWEDRGFGYWQESATNTGALHATVRTILSVPGSVHCFGVRVLRLSLW